MAYEDAKDRAQLETAGAVTQGSDPLSESDCSTMIRGICAVCGGIVPDESHWRKFCSERCKRRYYRSPDYKPTPKPLRKEHCLCTCQWCGKVKRYTLSDVDRGRGVVCSLRCAAERGEYLKRGGQGNSEFVPYHNCKHCGRVFVRRGQTVFCCEDCRHSDLQARHPNLCQVERQCRRCGVLFVRPPTRSPAVYCSVECRQADQVERERAIHRERMVSDHEYAANHRAMKRARKFDMTAKQARIIEGKKTQLKGRCPDCGRKVKRGEWHIDHFIPRALGGPDHIDNYRPLCGECNSKRKRALMPNAEYLAEREGGQLAIVCMV